MDVFHRSRQILLEISNDVEVLVDLKLPTDANICPPAGRLPVAELGGKPLLHAYMVIVTSFVLISSCSEPKNCTSY